MWPTSRRTCAYTGGVVSDHCYEQVPTLIRRSTTFTIMAEAPWQGRTSAPKITTTATNAGCYIMPLTPYPPTTILAALPAGRGVMLRHGRIYGYTLPSAVSFRRQVHSHNRLARLRPGFRHSHILRPRSDRIAFTFGHLGLLVPSLADVSLSRYVLAICCMSMVCVDCMGLDVLVSGLAWPSDV